MDIDTELLHKILDLLKVMILSRKELIEWIKEFIEDIKTQEITVNSAKTGATVLGVVSTIGLSTLLSPLAVAGLVTAGVSSLATAIKDYEANKEKEGNLNGKVETMKENDSKFSELMMKVEEGALQFQKELNISKEDAILLLLIGVPKAALNGLSVTRGVVKLGTVLPHLKAARDVMRAGVPFLEVAGNLGANLVSTTSKVLGGLGVVIGIVDVIYSWSTKNPNRKSAETLLPELEENLAVLEKMEGELSKLK